MPALVIRDIPPKLHRKLKAVAAQHRRSMTQEALVLLEEGLVREEAANQRMKEFPPIHKGPFPLTDEFLDWAKREGRE
jgi:hypothetical protein